MDDVVIISWFHVSKLYHQSAKITERKQEPLNYSNDGSIVREIEIELKLKELFTFFHVYCLRNYFLVEVFVFEVRFPATEARLVRPEITI